VVVGGSVVVCDVGCADAVVTAGCEVADSVVSAATLDSRLDGALVVVSVVGS
jgi:hypothetical protein